MDYVEAIILAVVEGITEFLPVSSTGHMIITSSIMGIAAEDFTKTFTVAIQFGAILSVVVLYWRRFLQSVNFYFKLLAAFLPAAIVGFLLDDLVDQLLENVIVVACSLIIGGVVLLFIDKWFKTERSDSVGEEPLSYPTAVKIGLFQCIAIIPGVSRSAATIIGGLSQKLTRKTAAEFSFFLAVPTMFAAAGYKIFKLYKEGGGILPEQVNILLVGNIFAFVVALVAIKSFIEFVTKFGFKLFGYYRIALGLFILILYFLNIPLTIV